MASSKLIEAVTAHSAELIAELEKSGLFTNTTDIGDLREEAVERFLRPLLPSRFGLAKGEVFSADGCQSAQLDVIIYDALYSSVFFTTRRRSILPVESIYGSIEVKSALPGPVLEKCCENVASVKSLPREATDMLDLTPTIRLNVDATTFGWSRNPCNHYVCPVMALHGSAPGVLLPVLNLQVAQHPERKQLLPDFVAVIQPGFLLTRMKHDAVKQVLLVTQPGADFDFYAGIDSGADTLSMFFLMLNCYLNGMRLRGVELQDHWSILAAALNDKLILK